MPTARIACRTWSPPPQELELPDEAVHVWRADLRLPAWRLQPLVQMLSAEEQSRADRFYFAEHRRRYVVCRGFLRIILSHYERIAPSRLQFSYGARGKPELAKNRALRFNLSHSDEMALYAIAKDRSVGIDLEHIRTTLDAEGLAKRYFSPREFEELHSLPAGAKHEAFLRQWTLKEAYLKATGEGLAGLEQVEVFPCGINTLPFNDFHEFEQKNRHWSIYQMKPLDDFIAALVLEGYGWQTIQFWVLRSS